MQALYVLAHSLKNHRTLGDGHRAVVKTLSVQGEDVSSTSQFGIPIGEVIELPAEELKNKKKEYHLLNHLIIKVFYVVRGVSLRITQVVSSSKL